MNLSIAHRLTLGVAALMLVSSLGGLVYGRTGLYDRDAATYPALLGQDALALLAIPLLLAAEQLARRGSLRGLLCWMGLLFYVAYFWYFYVVGIKFGPLFVVHIALVSMSLFAVVYLMLTMDLDAVKARFDSRMPVRLIGGFLIGTAVAFAALWLAVVIRTLATGQNLDDTSRFVIAIDGVVLLPLSFFGGIWIWRRHPLGYPIAGMLLVKVVATFLTLIATTLVSASWGLRIDLIQTVMYTAGLVAGMWLLFVCLRAVNPIGDGGLL